LKVLRTAGLLVLDKQGRNWFYRTDAEVLEAVMRELAALGAEAQDGHLSLPRSGRGDRV
jgi:hypothetical protein